MTCQPIAPCGYEPCDALDLIGQLLPSGMIWQIGQGRPIYDGFWSSVAEFWSDVSNGICAEWCEADPCTASRTLDRWAAVWNYPTDCTSLDTEKLCRWIRLITCEARPGTCEFIPQLLAFVGVSGVSVEIDRGCMAASDSRPGIIIRAPAWMIVHSDCCDAPFRDCGGVIPKIECLRHRYFPAGVTVTYQAV